jgi:hypothetical protein
MPNVTVVFSGYAGISTTLGTVSFLDVSGDIGSREMQYAAQTTDTNSARAFNSSFVADPVPTPEPGTLALALVGASALWMAGRDKRRR